MGADYICVDFVKINRDFKTLKYMVDNLKKAKIELLMTNSCLKNCPYIHTHTAALSHASNIMNKDKECYADWCLYKCQEYELKHVEEYIKSPWIRPEDVKEYEKIGVEHFKITERDFPTNEIIKRVKAYSEVKYNKIIIMLIISYGLFYPIVNSGQSNGKLFIQQELLLKFSVEKTSLIIGAILCVSRIVRVISNMAFNKIHSKYKEKVGFMLPILLMVSIFLMISGSMINNFIILKFIIMSLGYVIILFIRDPFKVYIQDLALRNVNNEEQQTLLTTMELSRKIIRTMISLNFTMILLNNPMKVVMVILFGLSIIEVLISIRLYKMILNIDKIEKKKRKIYVEEV